MNVGGTILVFERHSGSAAAAIDLEDPHGVVAQDGAALVAGQ
jgi:hypothetical protein